MKRGGTGQEGDGEGRFDEPRTYRMAFWAKAGPRHFPVEGCSDQAVTHTDMRVHFWHRHVQYTIEIMEKCNLPHPRCPL